MVILQDPIELEMSSFSDERGVLTVLENFDLAPFSPKRIFYINSVPSTLKRGHHAHRKCWQLLLVLDGTALVNIKNKNSDFEYILRTNHNALYVPPLNWLEFELSSPEATLIVLASENFDSDDYIYELEELRK